MDKYFEETVCSQCKNKCKNCVKLRVKQRDNCFCSTFISLTSSLSVHICVVQIT